VARILVADDSGYARRLLRQALQQGGHTVLEAASGASALESYFLNRPDVVLLDLTMGDMSGLDVLARLRELEPDARVVVVSADVQKSTATAVLEAGAVSFLGKPATAEELLAAIRAALEETVP
jgi:two-component system, chemotaxis family, chemotaxis protein CheY